MEQRDKDLIKLKWGLALKKILDENKEANITMKQSSGKIGNLIGSFGKLHTFSDIPKPALINIAKGRKNASTSTWIAILDALELSLTSFGAIYDAITDKELQVYKASMTQTSKPIKTRKATTAKRK